MAVKIVMKMPVEFFANITMRRALDNSAKFVRDYWLSLSPHQSGEYASGLLQDKSIIVRPGEIVIQNLAKHANWYEVGHKAFNIGLAILSSSKKTRVSKDGYRYLPIRIPNRGKTKFRATSTQKKVKDDFKRTVPKGKIPIIKTYGGIGKYEQRKLLKKPLKATSTDGNIVTISEKAIRQDPTKWLSPAVEGKKLSEKVQRETEPLVMNMIRQAILGEKERQKQTTGKNPKWFKPSMTKKK
jgi:hypothetical protein